MIKRFDLVRLKTIQRVLWLSGPPSTTVSPKGVWSVVAGVSGSGILMLAKGQTLIQIPQTDVEKIGDYDISNAMNAIKRIRNMGDLESHNDITLEK